MNNNNKGHKIRFNRVDVQVFLMTAVIVVFACGLIFLVNYSLSYGSMITALKERAENIHKYLENYLDVSMFYDLNVKEDGEQPVYGQFPHNSGSCAEGHGGTLSLYCQSDKGR